MSEIDLVSVGDVVYPPGGRLGPRHQLDVQLVLIHSGSARIAIDGGEPFECGAGSVALLLPGHEEQFAFADGEPTHHSWVQTRAAGPAPERLDPLPRTLPTSAALAELVRAAVDADRAPLPTHAPLLSALAAAAIWRYAGEAESRERGPSGTVERARAFLHANLADDRLDLARIARAAHVSAPHLVRRFRAELGVTPMAYLWQRRVEAGIDLLANTGLPVGDVAARCGFKSVYHFSRRVKARAGVSPVELRRARWAGR